MNTQVKTHKLHYRREGYMSSVDKLQVKRWLDYINESGIYDKRLKFKDGMTDDLIAANFFAFALAADYDKAHVGQARPESARFLGRVLRVARIRPGAAGGTDRLRAPGGHLLHGTSRRSGT